jgi:ferric-dicitrate binding protein FerR (iron transport regulator)
MKDERPIENLIARYLNGDCPDVEHTALLDWINSDKKNEKEYLEIKDIWDVTSQKDSKSNEQLIFFYKIQLEKSNRARIILINRVVAIAAVFIIGFIAYVLIPQKSVVNPQYLSTYSVPLGSRSKLVLFDGTEVNLNSGSSLTYSNEYNAGSRRVTLTGEGFFKVKSDKKHPFIVKTADFEVEATGTRFNVCAYDNDAFTNTTLAEGIVALRLNKSNQTFKIIPGERFKLNRAENTYKLSAVDVESELAWKDGQFIFKSIPFPELVKRLERWYDVKLQWSGEKLATYSYSGRFKNQETIWQVLDALKLTSPISYQKTTFREFKITYKSDN